ncbi:hypothetical protein JZ751_005709 [Albula glossodonta]|uniref:RRM domain-containing protein n=1 Tax=Albula glossodonta TaxID=121402 RepID=A0A8T2N541_9TELE|nr:hypothetical protein JZ751_005709 [Albula glossodonta]
MTRRSSRCKPGEVVRNSSMFDVAHLRSNGTILPPPKRKAARSSCPFEFESKRRRGWRVGGGHPGKYYSCTRDNMKEAEWRKGRRGEGRGERARKQERGSERERERERALSSRLPETPPSHPTPLGHPPLTPLSSLSRTAQSGTEVRHGYRREPEQPVVRGLPPRPLVKKNPLPVFLAYPPARLLLVPLKETRELMERDYRSSETKGSVLYCCGLAVCRAGPWAQPCTLALPWTALSCCVLAMHHAREAEDGQKRAPYCWDNGLTVQKVDLKMFIGGLSWQTTQAFHFVPLPRRGVEVFVTAEGLKEYFCKFGEVKECMVMRDPVTKRSSLPNSPYLPPRACQERATQKLSVFIAMVTRGDWKGLALRVSALYCYVHLLVKSGDFQE